VFLWSDYEPLPLPQLPCSASSSMNGTDKALDAQAKAAKTTIELSPTDASTANAPTAMPVKA
jgi:hypothetical protein